mmetsp:Transcript_33967/g.97850  ORF Transcript_33967/g.97850 Transcript_33967/m.97850 type:complete len:304 (+) Transcript_33967:95-1006(+)
MANLNVVGSVLKAGDTEAWELLKAATRVPTRRPPGVAQAKEACSQRPRSPKVVHFDEHCEEVAPSGASLPRPVLRNPLDRVWELEHQVSLGLCTILEEERQNVDCLKKYLADGPSRDFVAAGRAACEAELEFCRLADGPGSSVDGRLGKLQAELLERTGSIHDLMTPPVAPGLLGSSHCVEEHVCVLLQACREHIAHYDRQGATSDELATAHALGQLVLEVDREVLRMSHALIHMCDDPVLASAADRLGTSANTRPPLPSVDSLSHQLELENEMLKEIMHTTLNSGASSGTPQLRAKLAWAPR